MPRTVGIHFWLPVLILHAYSLGIYSQETQSPKFITPIYRNTSLTCSNTSCGPGALTSFTDTVRQWLSQETAVSWHKHITWSNDYNLDFMFHHEHHVQRSARAGVFSSMVHKDQFIIEISHNGIVTEGLGLGRRWSAEFQWVTTKQQLIATNHLSFRILLLLKSDVFIRDSTCWDWCGCQYNCLVVNTSYMHLTSVIHWFFFCVILSTSGCTYGGY